ncbi:glycosyltransferase [Labrys monachus]|uniref:Glycosyltransferase involved in cell wall biosynthesis n=1 Tax=Labrys monachus TaxID=217067 RepID=A0ABU0FC85_9HYPH|nr:glycosyltransferase family A protein [Labrys monachus]MDQ0391713.1 glycosyltransferase involved in cell wall biosynthesis [Labrys monachus]
MKTASIDVIVPCYDAQATLAKAVRSALAQKACGTVWIVDDHSTDGSLDVAERLAGDNPGRIQLVRQPANGGAARARNEGIRRSRSDLIAFLDADDGYEHDALHVPSAAFDWLPELAMVRLPLRPLGVPPAYLSHPGFSKAWRVMEMTVAGNMIVRRDILLACGGFPEHDLFRRFGGEDAALGNAIKAVCRVGTAFDQPGVVYRYRPGAFAQRLLDLHLFNRMPPQISDRDIEASRQISASIADSLQSLSPVYREKAGVVPIEVTYG